MRIVRRRFITRALRRPLRCLAAALLLVGAGGCASAFNPSFVELFDESGTGQNASVENATGHVPILFVNRLQYSQQLTAWLQELNQERRLGGLETEATDLSFLRPRVRMRVQVTWDNGETAEYEFIDGDGVFEIERREEEDIDADVPPTPVDPNLTENTLTRFVGACDVGRVEVVLDPQVFNPVFVRTLRVEVGDLAQETRVLVATANPQFEPILPDEVDDNLNVTLARNYNFREAPAPAINLTCGSVVGIVIGGTVDVPFTQPEDDPEDPFIAEQASVPGFLETNTTAEARIPGRFEFLVSVR